MKGIGKKLLSVLCAFTILASVLSPVKAKADGPADSVEIASLSGLLFYFHSKEYCTYEGTTNYNTGQHSDYETADNEIDVGNSVKYVNDGTYRAAYCVDLYKNYSSGSFGMAGTKKWSDTVASAVSWAIAHGCSNIYSASNDSDYRTNGPLGGNNWILDYYVTQAAIYCILDAYGVQSADGSHSAGHSAATLGICEHNNAGNAGSDELGYKVDRTTRERMLSIAKTLARDAMTAAGSSAAGGYADNPSVSINGGRNLTMSLSEDGTIYRSERFSINCVGTVLDNSFTYALAGVPEGINIQLKNENGQYYLEVPVGDAWKLANNTIIFKLNASANFSRLQSLEYQNGGQNVTFAQSVTADAFKKDASVDVTLSLAECNLRVMKTDKLTGSALAGAVYGLYSDSNCTNLVHQFDETGADGVSDTFTLVPRQAKYYIKEIQAPTGYLIDTETVVTVTIGDKASYNADMTATPVVVSDAAVMGELTLTKLASIYGQESKITLSGATFSIYPTETITISKKDVNGDLKSTTYTVNDAIESVVTNNSGVAVFGGLPLGSYRVVETGTPVGYLPYPGSIDVTFQYANETTPIIKLERTVTDDPVVVSITKKSVVTGGDLRGCTLKIVDADNKTVIEPWNTNDENPKIIAGRLTFGQTYKLVEVEPAPGYGIAEPVEFAVSYDSDEYDSTNKMWNITMSDDYTRASFIKLDDNGNPLAGCKMQLVETAENTVVESWTTTDEPHSIVGKLVVGKEYKLEETESVNGYAIAEPIVFILAYDSDKYSSTNKLWTVTMSDKKTEITFVKEDLFGNKLNGCDLQVVDVLSGEVVGKWTSTGSAPHTIVGKLIVGRQYRFEETKPADGYLTAEPMTFTVPNNGEATITMKDDTTKVSISKQEIVLDEEGNEVGVEIPGCQMMVVEAENRENVVVEWESDDTPHVIEGELVVGKTYVLIETSPADGYLTAEEIEFSVLDSGELDTDKTQKVIMVDDRVKVSISKQDVAGEEVPGCHLALYETDTLNDDEPTLIEEWDSTKEPHIIESLVVGKEYTLIETSPADGYATAEEITFIVRDSFDLTEEEIADNNTQKVVMIDETTKVSISKQDIAGEEIPGCQLKVVDAEDETKVIDEWVSGEKPHVIEGKLVIDKEYILIETKPADGYTTAEEITFTVQDILGRTQMVTMKDDVTTVSISKQDIAGEEIEGCKLKVVEADNENKVIDEWVSTDEPHVIVGKLGVNKEYLLIETKPADGFATATTIKFTVTDTEKIQKVTMVDEVTKVAFSKQDVAGKEIEGCKLKVVDMDGKLIDEWTSGKVPHVIEGVLVAGEKYKMIETSPANGFATAEEIIFTVTDTKDLQTITMKDDITTVSISKQDITGEEIEGCKLKVVDAEDETKVIDEWVSGKEPHIIGGKLVVGHKYKLIETQPADGFTTAETITFEVKDTGDVQKVVMVDEKTKISISKQDIAGKEIEGCHLKVVDAKDETIVIDEWDSTKKPHMIEGELVVGHEYKLIETKPADGYLVAEAITFKIKDTGEIQQVIMVDQIDELAAANRKPNTGDNTKADLWMTTMMLGLAGMVTMQRYTRKKKEE